MTSILRALAGLLGFTLAALIMWALSAGDFAEAGKWLSTDPWGIVTLVDLYLGFFIAAIVIGAFERNWGAVLWIAPIPVLGNVWTAVWFVLRCRVLLARLSSR